MATETSAQTRTGVTLASSAAFDRFAGIAGIVTGVSSLLYAVFFLLVKGAAHDLLPPLLLALGGFLATAVAVALYARVRAADGIFAAWALLLAVLGQFGTALHGVTDLANVLAPAAHAPDLSALPNPADPRGFSAFGVVGVAVFVFAWLIQRSGSLPRGLGYLGYALAVALVALFLGALFGNPASSLFILIPGGFASLIATPAWNIWLGALFLQRRGA